MAQQEMKKGVQRGGAPLAGVWGCPPDIIIAPFLARKGVRGMVDRVCQRPGADSPVDSSLSRLQEVPPGTIDLHQAGNPGRADYGVRR